MARNADVHFLWESAICHKSCESGGKGEQLSPMKNIHRRLVIYAIKFSSAAAFLAIYTTDSFWWSSHAVTTAAVVGITL